MNSAQPQRPATRAGFEIAVICALPFEADAVGALFDHHWDDEGTPYDKAAGDPNAYSTGAVGRHNVVLAHMSGIGKASAAAVAASCRASFPNIKLALIVGVCGVVPFHPSSSGERVETVLGDVIVSSGVIQYDLGRRLPEKFVLKDTLQDTLGRPDTEIRTLLAKLRGLRGRRTLQGKMAGYMEVLRGEPELAATYPGAVQDKLFEATYRHVTDGMLCEECACDGELVPRASLQQSDRQPTVHFGLIASGDTVMKSGEDRDAIARQAGVIGFEMEGAGVWDIFPCVVIKGACDYADSHKTKVWQRYAAATAAACMKAFLGNWTPSNIATAEPSIGCAALPYYRITLPENPRFVGRDKTLNALKEMLFVRKTCQKATIFGLGGVGKTQVALKLAYWTKKYQPEFSIFWVSALSNATFEQNFSAMAKILPIQSGGEDDDPKESIRQYLSSEAAGPWLLVVDNADDRDVLFGSADTGGISGYLPESDDGLTLFTTRSREVAVSVARSDVIELHAMDPPEAADYLEKLLFRGGKAEAAELLKELSYLPLAITQAASYLNTTQASIPKYLSLLRKADQETASLMSREFYDDTRYKGSQNAIATTWLVSFNQIRKSDSATADLLAFLSCIEPKEIPQSILPRFELEEQMVYAIGTLCGYAFLTRRENSEVFDMHSLVHLATRIWLQREGLIATTEEKATRHLATVFPSNDYTNRNIWREYLPHASRVLQRSKALDIAERSDLLFWVGQCLRVDGRIKEAVRSLEEADRWRNRHLAEDHPDRLASQHALAIAYQADDKVKEAAALLEQVVTIETKTLDADHPKLLASQHELAGAYLADGQVKKAVTLLEQVVAIEAKTPAEDHTDRLTSQHELARAYIADDQVKKAVVLLEQIIAIETKTLAEDHPNLLASQHELAGAYQADGQVKKAVALLEQVVTIETKTLDEGHPNLLASQYELVEAYKTTSQVEKAIALLEQVVAIETKTLAEDHPRLLGSQYNLLVAYKATGQDKKATELCDESYRLRLALGGFSRYLLAEGRFGEAKSSTTKY